MNSTKTKRALIVVDVQNDFCTNGSLAVQGSDEIIPVINKLAASSLYDVVVATQDWHPSNHKSFASQHAGRNVFDVVKLNGQDQCLWPDHCVQGTKGAEFHPALNVKFDAVFKKGTNPEIDSYSGFLDNDRKSSTGMAEWLRDNNVDQVTVVGLATDYCVKATVLDAISEGFDVRVVSSACRAVSDQKGALKEMSNAGALALTDIVIVPRNSPDR